MTSFSVAEAFTILTSVSMLAGVAAPSVNDYVEQARSVKAIHDSRTIAIAVVRVTNDVAAQKQKPDGWARYELLVSSGDLPALGSGGDPRWLALLDERRVGLLRDHLVTNDARYASTRGRSAVSATGWRGPYVDGTIGPDPWGHRYAVNARTLMAGGSLDAFVLSAGPNGLVETPYEADGVVAGGDDVLALVSSGR
jgi:hypothetical protein